MSTTQTINSLIENGNRYANSLTEYSRRKTITVNVGDVPMGSDYPIRVQSMTTIDTLDTVGSVEQTIRMVESGCEYVRITAPSVKEAQNLDNIRKELRVRGYSVPLVADIHFTPNAAELAARLVEKVRINPGNYADKKRFETIDYTEIGYQVELDRIRDKFLPLVNICKEYGTAMRIGTNHGSLSDRILSRYGDTPLGMVESALEFLRICEDENYFNIVLSMKASNTQVMVEAYRLLCKKLAEEGLKPYPLHLGVTEAGEGEDGRIKSAVGIGTLLEDGLGDTVRVSLTEDPEFEAPVAKALIDRYTQRKEKSTPISAYTPNSTLNTQHSFDSPINPFQYFRRHTHEVANFGGHNVPRVIADFSQIEVSEHDDLKPIGHFYLPLPDKWTMNDLGADYIYTANNPAKYMLPMGLKEILDAPAWDKQTDKVNKFPLFTLEQYQTQLYRHDFLNFLSINLSNLDTSVVEQIKADKTLVLAVETDNEHAMPALRRLFFELIAQNVSTPAVLVRKYENLPESDFQLFSATDCGGLLIDGFGDGILLKLPNLSEKAELLTKSKSYNSTAFGILQAARTRMSKTEYISCPSCGRTLFDLQETTALIRKRTEHLKGVKIGIMGCIVNGPGEMADADYGYVGVGKDKIALYRGQNVVKKSVHADNAVDELIGIIKEDGIWFEPATSLEAVFE
ncbi:MULTISPECIES: (E)-4-hydroxy-3-methylbut-2-enyl-diphosphate synthase [unclassified Arcicella]|uniref:(E)-4-hydroxy-3-methylbut-2-enyl-diphosphate synthase n=1 Tax=unclassified Arcicella TaxID=2644986 RepID=UPI0028616CD3|nr:MULTISPECIES: (E)-4-hydroxy-3-methylbut-2-enyl-diphosphate synthase [unclassified Arcicella]MDR6561820.1 (E)-4-hydroxy-3-methylbut-2-enyl-diphosphate synthase [Arcicella sp. BE51]MDR6813966.1 (E)-4-hydroxy-3-methylbut-2-enyl-diphosphate synthase [Arcicella sp. BE140]MDR6825327.1 (E)-4-hydroxy-3-methylbut-2-enyl-diphosphate synthase [Arcicella sp. BE139]